MSDVGKLERNQRTAPDAAELGELEVAPSALEDSSKARQRAGDELSFRASGGRGGVAPMQRLMDERRAVGGQLAGRIQRKADGDAGGGVEVPEGGGAALPGPLRQKFEPKLGADLSDVRVHTGGASAQAAAGLGARAFTVGKDVHFNAGEFAPGSKEGDKLLAHELTHVVQGKKSGVQRKAEPDAKGQEGGGGGAQGHDAGGGGGGAQGHAGGGGAAQGGAGAQEVSHPDEPAEIEADAVAEDVVGKMHGAKKDKKKDKKKKKEPHGGAQDAKGSDEDGDHEGGDAHGGEEHGEHGGEEHGGEHGGGGAHGGAGKGGAGAAPQERPAQISAKFIGVGRKIFRVAGAGSSPSLTPPTGPKKPSTPAEYQALPGWTDFLGNCSAIGVDAATSLGFWRTCMDQLFTNDEQVRRIGNDKNAIMAYVDSAGARSGFSQFADAMFARFPLDMNANYALWSGKNAYQFAQGAGCQVLEGTQLGSVFNNVKTAFAKDWNVMQSLWRAISDAYARKIAAIMAGKNIKVFHRKAGDIFATVESTAIKQVTDKTKTKINFEFHALLVPGLYNFEADYDGLPNNDQARKDVTAAAGGDENKAKTACTGKVKIFDFPAGAPPAAMQDLGGVTSESGSLARLDPNNADVTAKVDGIKKQLTKKKP